MPLLLLLFLLLLLLVIGHFYYHLIIASPIITSPSSYLKAGAGLWCLKVKGGPEGANHHALPVTLLHQPLQGVVLPQVAIILDSSSHGSVCYYCGTVLV